MTSLWSDIQVCTDMYICMYFNVFKPYTDEATYKGLHNVLKWSDFVLQTFNSYGVTIILREAMAPSLRFCHLWFLSF